MLRALALLCLTLAAPARAEIPENLVRLEVLPGWATPDGGRMMGLRLVLAPGWKTYWRSPGAAGLAPRLDFAASTGIAGIEPRWPVPHVFHLGELRSIGYAESVTIPVQVSRTGGPARLEGTLEIGVCRDVCVPVTLAVSAALPEDAGRRDPALAAALVDQPQSAAEAGARAACRVAPDGDGDGGVDLSLSVAVPPQGGDEAVVVESADPSLWVSETRTWREGGTLRAEAEAEARDGGPVALDRSGLRITVLGDGRAVDIRGCEAG